MNELLGGETPSLDDYSEFIGIVEKLPIDLLWKILNEAPLLNEILRTVVNKTLQERVARKNVEDSLERIANGVRDFLG